MPTIDIEAAQAEFSRLVDQAAAGTEIVIARAGTPIAKLVPLEAKPARKDRVLGTLAGHAVPADFNRPLPDDLLDTFEGR